MYRVSPNYDDQIRSVLVIEDLSRRLSHTPESLTGHDSQPQRSDLKGQTGTFQATFDPCQLENRTTQ